MSKPDNDSKSEPAGRFAYDGLDRVIHEKARLSVLTSLVAHPKGLVFGDLKQMCGLTDGNLSRHLQVLDEAGLIAIEKGFFTEEGLDVDLVKTDWDSLRDGLGLGEEFVLQLRVAVGGVEQQLDQVGGAPQRRRHYP